MTDDLRDRIAKALYGQILSPVPLFDTQPDEVQAAWLADADAVIRELGLRREVLPSGGVTEPVHGVTWFRQGGSRWVTEWVPDE